MPSRWGALFERVKSMARGKNLQKLKYVIAVVPIAWIFLSVDLEKFLQALHETAVWTLPVIIFAAVLLMFLQGIRWWVLLRAFLPGIPLREVLSSHFKGIYYSMFLPTSAAQDVVRSVLLSRNNDYGVTWGSTWITRITSLVVLLLMSLYGTMTIKAGAVSQGLTTAVATAGGIILLLGFLSFSKSLTRIFKIAAAKILPEKLMVSIERVREGIYQYRNKPGCMTTVMGITVFTQLLNVVNGIFLIKGITGSFYIAESFAYIPLIEIICLSVPLTPGGIGVREGLTALMFHQIGLPAEQLGTYVLIGLSTMLIKVVGGVPVLYDSIVAMRNKRQKKTDSAT